MKRQSVWALFFFVLFLPSCSKLVPGTSAGLVEVRFVMQNTSGARLATSTFALRTMRLTCGSESLRLPIDGFVAKVPWGSTCHADQIEIQSPTDLFECAGELRSPGDSVACASAFNPADKFNLVYADGLGLSSISTSTSVRLEIRNRSRSSETTPTLTKISAPAQPVDFQISAELSVTVTSLSLSLEYDAVTDGYRGAATIRLMSELDPPSAVDLWGHSAGGGLEGFQGSLAMLSPSPIQTNGAFDIQIALSAESARRFAQLSQPEPLVLTLHRDVFQSSFTFLVHPPQTEGGRESGLLDLNPASMLPSKVLIDELRLDLSNSTDGTLIDRIFAEPGQYL